MRTLTISHTVNHSVSTPENQLPVFIIKLTKETGVAAAGLSVAKQQAGTEVYHHIET